MLSMKYCLKVFNLFSILVAYSGSLTSIIRLRSKHESYSFVSPEYACKILAQMDWYNFIYGTFSTIYSVLDSLSCVNYFVEIENDFDKMLNWKVVKDLLNYLLLKFHEFIDAGSFDMHMLEVERLNFSSF